MKTKQLNQTSSSLLSSRGLLSKKLLVFTFLLVSTMFCTSEIFAQTAPTETIYKDWLFAGESANHVDVSTRIIKCNSTSPDQVHLFIFNEGSTNNVISFVVTVTNNDSKEAFSTAITHTVNRAEMIRAMCDNDESLNDLKISLPSNYNPNNLTLSVTFN